MAGEFQRHWDHPNNEGFAAIYVQAVPNHGAVIESYEMAQEVFTLDRL